MDYKQISANAIHAAKRNMYDITIYIDEMGDYAFAEASYFTIEHPAFKNCRPIAVVIPQYAAAPTTQIKLFEPPLSLR